MPVFIDSDAKRNCNKDNFAMIFENMADDQGKENELHKPNDSVNMSNCASNSNTIVTDGFSNENIDLRDDAPLQIFNQTNEEPKSHIDSLFPESTGVTSLNEEAQKVIEDLNLKRKQDSQLILDFKSNLDMQIQKVCTEVENGMFQVYDKVSTNIQPKLQQFYATLDKITKLEFEIQQFKDSLGKFYEDVQ